MADDSPDVRIGTAERERAFSWLWFLAVPAAGAILYAGRKDDS